MSTTKSSNNLPKGSFLVVPNKAAMFKLPDGQLRVYLALCDFADAQQRCFPSFETLAEKANVSRRSVIRNVAGLIEAGMLTAARQRKDNGLNYSNRYQIATRSGDAGDTTTSVTHDTIVVTPMAPPSDTGDTMGSVMDDTLTHPVNNSPTRTHPNNSNLGASHQGAVPADDAGSEADQSILEASKGELLREEASPKPYGDPAINAMFEYWLQTVGTPIIAQSVSNRNACSNLIKKHGDTGLRKLIEAVAMSLDDQYAPRIPDFATMQFRLNDLLAWLQRSARVQAANEIPTI